jgi:hypothetical protein
MSGQSAREEHDGGGVEEGSGRRSDAAPFDVRIHNERTRCDDGAGELRGRSPATHTKDQQHGSRGDGCDVDAQ